MLEYGTGMESHYRIRAIKPPLIQNSNKPPLFYPKSPLFGAFLVKFWKNFNKPPAQNLDFFIDRRRFIDADTVVPIQFWSHKTL